MSLMTIWYHRWGDAPVHSLAVAMLLRKDEVHFFNDIGYKHNPLMHCPTEPYLQNKCHCNPHENFGMLYKKWLFLYLLNVLYRLGSMELCDSL